MEKLLQTGQITAPRSRAAFSSRENSPSTAGYLNTFRPQRAQTARGFGGEGFELGGGEIYRHEETGKDL